jgi:hypothetical protein
MDGERKTIECVLCRKKYDTAVVDVARTNRINAWSRVCNDCVGLWEEGKRSRTANKRDGKPIVAAVINKVELEGRAGNPQAETELRALDIIMAMGATKLRGTDAGDIWRGDKPAVFIGRENEGHEHYAYLGGSERVRVPRARAEAMARIIAAFYDACAKARVRGFDEGRNLVAALARGEVKVEDYSAKVDNARAGYRPPRD